MKHLMPSHARAERRAAPDPARWMMCLTPERPSIATLTWRRPAYALGEVLQ
jgi:hypothetical protein